GAGGGGGEGFISPCLTNQFSSSPQNGLENGFAELAYTQGGAASASARCQPEPTEAERLKEPEAKEKAEREAREKKAHEAGEEPELTDCIKASGSRSRAQTSAIKHRYVWCAVNLQAKEAAEAEIPVYEKQMEELDSEYKIICIVHEPDTAVLCAA